MHCAPGLALTAAYLMSACATSTPPSPPQTVARTLPTECLQSCPALALLQDGDEIAATLWMFELINEAGECRRMHDVCRAAAQEK